MIKKGILWLLIIVFILLLFVVGALYYFLGTHSGLKSLVGFVNQYTQYQINAKQIKGDLLSGSNWDDLVISDGDFNVKISHLAIDWDVSPFASSSKANLVVDKLLADHVVIHLPSKKSEPKNTPTFPIQLKDIKLPVNTTINHLNIKHIKIYQQAADKNQQPIILDNVVLQASIKKKGLLDLKQLKVDMPNVSYIGKGSIYLVDDWQVQLDSQITLSQLLDNPSVSNSTLSVKPSIVKPVAKLPINDDSLSIVAQLDGAIKKQVNLKAQAKGIAEFDTSILTTHLLIAPKFSGNLNLKNAVPKLLPPSSHIQLSTHFDGVFDGGFQTNFKSEIDYTSPQIRALNILLDGEFKDNQIQAHGTVNRLDTKERLNIRAKFDMVSQKIKAHLSSNQLSIPLDGANSKDTLIIKELNGSVVGDLNNYYADMSSVVSLSQLQGIDASIKQNFLNVPIKLKAKGSQSSLSDLNLLVLLNNQPIQFKGHGAWAPKKKYQLSVLSDVINLGKQYPKVSDLDFKVNGVNNDVDIQGKLAISGQSIPNSQIWFMADGDLTKSISANLDINTLGGKIKTQLHTSLSPINMSGKLTTTSIQPQLFYPQIKGSINSDLNFKVSQKEQEKSKNWLADIKLNHLSGRLQGFPLKGRGEFIWDGFRQQLDFSDLDIHVAGNYIQANGELSTRYQLTKGIQMTIDAKHLKQLYPNLSGQLFGDVAIQGSLQKPKIMAKIKANQLTFQHHNIRKADLDANLDLSSDVIDINLSAKDMLVEKQPIKSLNVTAKGALTQHQLFVQLTSDLVGFKTRGVSSINIDKKQWEGNLKELNIVEKQLGKWQISQPTQLLIGEKNVGINDLCLIQKNTQLCADGSMSNGSGQFNVKLDQLDIGQFKAWLPKGLNTDALISATANVQLKNYQPNIEGQLKSNRARLRWFSGEGAISTKIEQLQTQFVLKDSQLVSQSKVQLKGIGKVDAGVKIPNIKQSKIDAQLALDIPSVAFIESLYPQLNQVLGEASGKLRISGDWKKQLKTQGHIDFQGGQLNYPQYGTEVRDIRLSVFADKGNLIGFSGQAKSNGGDLQLKGQLNPLTRKGDINISGQNFAVANSQKLRVITSPNLNLSLGDSVKLTGDINIPSAFIVPELNQSKVSVSEDVVLPDTPLGQSMKEDDTPPIEMDINVNLGRDVRVSSADIETRLHGSMNIVSNEGKSIRATGSIEIEKGDIQIYGQELTIERGRIIFDNGPIDNPSLDLRASRDIEKEEITVGVNVLGNVANPKISLFSIPSLSDSSILSYLIFGRPPSGDSFGAAALLQTAGAFGTNAIVGNLKGATGLDVIDVGLSSVEVGKNFGKKLYLGLYRSFITEINQLLLKYKFSGRTTLDAGFSSQDITIDLIKQIETD